ncbi:MAG: hypothetical protein DIU78_000365 [Pseudomonadota bacterium]
MNEANQREQAPRSGPLSAVPIHELITRWDLDKTYLRSRFDTLRELVTAALEPPERKRSVPGAAAVLRELSSRGAWVHILSGSPRQMRRKLVAKLELDGVRWNELTLKPNLSNLLFLRFQALRDQLGYKLPELLKARVRDERRLGSGMAPREVLVGDDSESDAFVYSLYADLCAGTVSASELERVLRAGHAYEATLVACRRALAQVPRVPVVDRILIHLDNQTPPSRFRPYGSRLVPFYNYLQAAFVLLERGILAGAAVLRIAGEFLDQHGFSPDAVARSYLDLVRRGHATGTVPSVLARALEVLGSSALPVDALRRAVRQLELDVPHVPTEPEERPPELDYAALASRYRGGRNRRRPGQRFF